MPELQDRARVDPRRLAGLILETGETLDYGTLHARSARLAQHFVASGLAVGDAIAILLPNTLRYFEVAWAARRAGLYYVPISTHLTTAETQYMIEDSGAKVLLVTETLLPRLSDMPHALKERLEILVVDGSEARYPSIVDAPGAIPELPERPMGLDFAYSSGTTGKPKGIKQPIRNGVPPGSWLGFLNFSSETVYLSTAPLYHAAPLRMCMRCIALGGTTVVMGKFEAVAALDAIRDYRVTHSQWVPTMFVRLLNLPDNVREGADVSSMKYAIHAAAPCPPDIKRKMLAWWGPIVWEYYAGSERNGATLISPEEWLLHPGSVGKGVLGSVKVVDEEGELCAPRKEGLVYFADGPRFEYHNDPAKSAGAYNDKGWSTLGDIGYLDEDGYLYLTDRQSNMIISGGVNIYPQEVENLLQSHPAVSDAAVIGVPDSEYGEQVMAVVQVAEGVGLSASLADELIAFCRSNLSHIKCPRRVELVRDLPRTETGKLLKRVVRDQYRVKVSPP